MTGVWNYDGKELDGRPSGGGLVRFATTPTEAPAHMVVIVYRSYCTFKCRR